MTGTLDGFTVPESGGLDIGHMFQSIVKAGASFKLRGEAGHGCGGPILLKIPIDSGSLFESGYSIDDLLIGKVGVVGICKGKVTDDLRSSFDYFQAKDKQQPSEDDRHHRVRGRRGHGTRRPARRRRWRAHLHRRALDYPGRKSKTRSVAHAQTDDLQTRPIPQSQGEA